MKSKSLLFLLTLLLVLSLCGCQSAPKTEPVAQAQIAESAAEPTAEPASNPVSMDWSAVDEAPASDFTYEIVESTDPQTGESVSAVRLTGYTGSASVIKMPEKIDGMYVRLCAEGLFRDNTAITHVALPRYMHVSHEDSKTRFMFANCTALQEVRLSDEYMLIPNDMFANCTALHTVVFPERELIPYAPNGGIQNRAFQNCVSLTSITLPDEVDSIDEDAFAGCTALETVVAPSVHIISHNAFRGCSALTALEISAYDPYINLYGPAFIGCTSLKKLTLTAEGENPGRTTLVEDGDAYYIITNHDDGSTSVMLACVLPGYEGETISMRADIDTIGVGAFAGSGVKHVEIPAAVTLIDTYAFNECPNLETVTVAAGSALQGVSSSAFYDCPVLKRIDLSNAPESAGISDDFDRMPALEQVVYPGQDPNATPMPVFTEAQITAALDAALAPYRAEMDAEGYKVYIRMDGDKLRGVQLDTQYGNAASINSRLLHDVTVAIVSTPEMGFPDSLRTEADSLSYAEYATLSGNTYYLSLEMGYMYVTLQINHLNG